MVRLTDRLDMTIVVGCDFKQQNKDTKQSDVAQDTGDNSLKRSSCVRTCKCNKTLIF